MCPSIQPWAIRAAGQPTPWGAGCPALPDHGEKGLGQPINPRDPGVHLTELFQIGLRLSGSLGGLEQALLRAEGFASYEALRHWVRQTPGVEVKDKTLYTLVRTRFKTRLKVARRSHTKKPWSDPGLPGYLSGPPPAAHAPSQRAPGVLATLLLSGAEPDRAGLARP